MCFTHVCHGDPVLPTVYPVMTASPAAVCPFMGLLDGPGMFLHDPEHMEHPPNSREESILGFPVDSQL